MLSKELPIETNFESTPKNETREIVLANPTNEDMVDNLLPIWTGREVEKKQIIEILEESEGDNDKGRIFMDANEKTIILNTKIHYGHYKSIIFPVTTSAQ